MIRFLPDSWRDALLRPFAMVSPDANVYVEIPAPDLRLAAVVLLVVAVLASWRGARTRARVPLLLAALTLLAFVPWLLTTGNGRYFLPVLLMVGPVAIGLAWALPVSRGFRLLIAGGLVAAQTYVVALSAPFDTWTWVRWKEAPYFHLDARVDAAPATYVTLSSISYSLIAPQFPANARWLSVASEPAVSGDEERLHRVLAASQRLFLVAPTIHGQVAADGSPVPEARRALGELLAGRKLALAEDLPCRLLPSRGIAAMGRRDPQALPPSMLREAGFWLCPLRYPVEVPARQLPPVPPHADAVFEKVQQMCPRFFPPAGTRTVPIPAGALRHYPASDMKVYVLNDGTVLYKYWRALNPVAIGTVEGLLSGREIFSCDRIPGRTGLPWERGI